MNSTEIIVHGNTDTDELKIIEIPAVLRLEVPSSTSDEEILKLVKGCRSDVEATVVDSKNAVIEQVGMHEPKELASLIKFSDVWVFDLEEVKLVPAK